MDGGIQQLPLSATPVIEVVLEYHLRGTSKVQNSAMALADEDYGGPAPQIRDLNSKECDDEAIVDMRKRVTPISAASPPLKQEWLNVESAASVELTSEDSAFPVESALLPQGQGGWRAAGPGLQTIRLIFDEPQRLSRICVAFEENETSRTQEFVLRWSPDQGKTFREIVRQQWNFTSPDAARETEDYAIDLSNVTVLDLIIEPDKENGKACASLLSLRLA